MTEAVPSSALSEVSLRLLCHDDIDTVKHLCGDWFPIEQVQRVCRWALGWGCPGACAQSAEAGGLAVLAPW